MIKKKGLQDQKTKKPENKKSKIFRKYTLKLGGSNSRSIKRKLKEKVIPLSKPSKSHQLSSVAKPKLEATFYDLKQKINKLVEVIEKYESLYSKDKDLTQRLSDHLGKHEFSVFDTRLRELNLCADSSIDKMGEALQILKKKTLKNVDGAIVKLFMAIEIANEKENFSKKENDIVVSANIILANSLRLRNEIVNPSYCRAKAQSI